jgi:sugar phosphate isomerase/epimerase
MMPDSSHTRRDFLARLAAGAVGVVTAACREPAPVWTSARPADSPALDRIGIQLYTVRDAMGRDFEGTLERLARMGYDEVEFAGYFGHSPARVRAILERVGLSAPAAHVGLEEVRANLSRTVGTAAEAGHSWIVVPWIPTPERTVAGYRRLADLFNEAGHAAREAGLRFAYHNHDFEFDPAGGDGSLPLDLLLEWTDPALVDFELDLYWTSSSGHDPLAWFDRHPGRFPLVHVKDMDGSPRRRMVDPGDGVIDFPAIIARRERAGIRHWFVEHDQPDRPFRTARNGLAYLRGLREQP